MNHFPLYSVITKPFAHKGHWSGLCFSVAFIWATSIGTATPLILQLQVRNDVCINSNYDIITREGSFIYETVWVVYGMIIPLFVLIIVYCLIARALKANAFKHENNRAMEHRNKQNAKIMRMFFTIITIFFLFTMPHTISFFYLSYLLMQDQFSPKIKEINTLTYTLLIPACANGCVNPFIYAKMHRDVNGYVRKKLDNIRRVFRRWRNNNNGVMPSTCNFSDPFSLSIQ